MKISEKLLRLRENKNLTQEELAKIAGVTPTSIYNWERDNKSPRTKYITQICKYFNYDLGRFMDEESDYYGANEKLTNSLRRELSKAVPDMTDNEVRMLLNVWRQSRGQEPV